jgi:hypothetical protein
MSVTFWAPDAPTVAVKPYPEEEPDYVEERSTLPEVNLANANAREMLQLIGLDSDDLCGTLQPNEFGPVIARLQRLLNSEAARAPALKEISEPCRRLKACTGNENLGNVVHVGLGPRSIDGGRTDGYIQRRARDLLDLFVQARQANYCTSWG